MSTITDGTTTVTVLDLAESQLRRRAGSIAHQLLGSDRTEITLRPRFSAREGSLTVRCATLADVLALDAMHSPAALLTLTHDTEAAMSLVYAVTGDTSWVARDGRFVFTAQVTEAIA